MNKRIYTVIMTALLVLLMAGSAMCATNGCESTYDSSVTLENKNSTWAIIEDDGISALVEYNASGETFDWRVTGTMPNAGGYCLIYYADYPDRFNKWRGDNPGALIGEIHASNPNGIGIIEHNACGSTELDMNLPCCPDANMNISEHDYCGAPDYYDHCTGAKLWLVPKSDYTEPAMTAWNHASYLFDTELIWYDDTDLVLEIEETTVNRSCVSAGDTVLVGAIVRDGDGEYDLANMVVTANMSVYGVDEIVVLDYIGMIDCTSADYSSTVLVTTSTIDECNDEYGSFDIYAEDPSGANGTLEAYLDVEPGDAYRLVIDGPNEVLSLTYGCIDLDVWDYTNPEYYAAIMTVILVDEYDNQVYDTGCAMDVTAEAYVSHISGSGGYMDAWTGFIAAGDLFSQPCTSMFTVRCLNDPNIGWGYHTVEFLPSVYTLDITLENDTMYYDNGSVDCTTVYAQLMDDTGNPISMPGVLVEFYHGDGDSGKVYIDDPCSETDENGIANTTVCIVTDIACTANIYAEAECRAGYTVMDIVEPVLYYIEVYPDEPEMTSDDDPQELEYTCFTDHGTEMCCPEEPTWTCNEFAEVDEDGYLTAGDTEGIAVVEANITGVIGTAEIVINALTNCSEEGEIIANEEFVLTSGTVSITGNYSGNNGYACVQAMSIWDPECEDATKYAWVYTNENVTLDLNGTGDTWILNGTEWEFYAAGDTAEHNVLGEGEGDERYTLVDPVDPCEGVSCPSRTCVGYDMWSYICVDGVCVKDTLLESNSADCGYEAPSSGSSGGGGGTYPPDPVPTPTPNATTTSDNATSDDPAPADPKPTVNLPGGDKAPDTTPDETEGKSPDRTDPTNTIFIVLGIMALIVIGYVIYRKSQQ